MNFRVSFPVSTKKINKREREKKRKMKLDRIFLEIVLNL